MTPLPTGRRGQALALACGVLMVGLIWLGAVSPALGWFQARADHLAEQRTLAGRMASLVATTPALQQRVAAMDSAGPAPRMMLDGATDAVAGAALQQAVQGLAATTGATITSAEVLPAETVGSYRRISLRVTASGGWAVIVALFGAVSEATPRMLVDDVALRRSLALGAVDQHPMEASFTIIAFHAGPVSAP